MKIPLYQVDAFSDRAFSGDPAAVCPLDAWLPDDTLQSIAAENNLSETAFFVRRGEFKHYRDPNIHASAFIAANAVVIGRGPGQKRQSNRTGYGFTTGANSA